MANYNVTCKLIRGSQGSVETSVQNYINSIDSTKVIRGISICRYGSDQVMVLIIHDT